MYLNNDWISTCLNYFYAIHFVMSNFSNGENKQGTSLFFYETYLDVLISDALVSIVGVS